MHGLSPTLWHIHPQKYHSVQTSGLIVSDMNASGERWANTHSKSSRQDFLSYHHFCLCLYILIFHLSLSACAPPLLNQTMAPRRAPQVEVRLEPPQSWQLCCINSAHTSFLYGNMKQVGHFMYLIVVGSPFKAQESWSSIDF